MESETSLNPSCLPKDPPSVREIFLEFLLIGASSFGGGLVAYLQRGLVVKRQWIDEKTFLEFLSISQSLPGLNTTNMAVLIGDRLRGSRGSLAALIAICLPGGLLMFCIGLLYRELGDTPIILAMLKGVSAAAVGMILATIIQLSRKALGRTSDLLFVFLAVLGVLVLHQSVPRVLFAVGALAIFSSRPSVIGELTKAPRESQ